MEQPAPRPRYTVAEYQALEKQSEVRHEYFDGELFVMAGADIPHNLLCINFVSTFKQALRGRSCRAVMENVQLAVQEGRHLYLSRRDDKLRPG